ncbi:hypothetical protein MSG28_012669 [Choristoneura fumiferana]|uniref:Uncharacterized protein n=1 Tax=Choristoneura fumiferana TaxID=7141 RepID=A0ACC0JHK3_CHOFU|nr:hypothetical protein MSG28_012669 [Choristoneura fumiferana]
MEPLWPTGKPIPEAKLKDLKSLLHLIPQQYLSFYVNLDADKHIEDDLEGFSELFNGKKDFLFRLNPGNGPKDITWNKPAGNGQVFGTLGSSDQGLFISATGAGKWNLDKNTEISATGAGKWNLDKNTEIFVALGPMALIFSSGMGLGTATVMIFVALGPMALIFSSAQIKGYKFAFIIISIPMIIACVLQYFATSAKLLLVATIIQGLTFGGNTILGIVLVAEITHPKYRGTFLVIKSATFFWGVWVSNAIGTFSKWRNIPLVCIWPAVFALVSCFAWPESPYWLASKGRVDECKKSFRWLRGQSPNAEKELSLLVTKKHPSIKIKNVLSFIKSTIVLPQFYKPMILNIATFFFYSSCGKYVCQTYILVIIKTITKSDRAAYTGMLIIDGITVFGMYLGSYVAKKVSRRFMFFSTSGSTIFFLFALSLYLYLIQFGVINQNNTLSLILLMLYSFSVSWGPMLLCTNIFSEITPMRFKPFISSVSACFMYTMQALFLKLGPWLFKSVGFSGTCAVYGTLSIFPVLVLFKYLPETMSTPTPKSIEDVRIVGGDDIDISEAPYQVSLVNRGQHSCGGTIISEDIIVTAAHCIYGSNPLNFQVRVGSSSSQEGGTLIQVADFMYHPKFSYTKMDSDIGLLKLKTPLEFSDTVKPIGMVGHGEEIDDGALTEVSGWGAIEEGGGKPRTLQKVSVPKVNEHVCNAAYAPMYSITPRMLCAGVPSGGKDACQGDSGGPLVHNGRLAGVVSWGIGCARPTYPGVYAKVSALRTWVDDNILFLKIKQLLRV